ncbi:MAK10-like protein [Tanacetum coccineum]|uniref:MAK10-like protein n=1 Tax=Tanacetum coccineum TaxID=301880 RepID=A0ABQ4ZK62_9ASTR
METASGFTLKPSMLKSDDVTTFCDDVKNTSQTMLTSNWLERPPVGSISTWEDFTTRFLAYFFPPGRTTKVINDILMFQQHHGESLSEAWTRFKDFLQKVPHHGIDLWLQLQIFYYHVNPARHAIDHSAGGKIHDKSVKESWELIENLALCDHESWNDLRDFVKPVKAISLPQDVPNTSDRRLIELENQVQRLMEAHLAHKPFIQVNKIAFSCENCGGPHNTQYCMENSEQAFVDYASSRTDEAGESEELIDKKIDWSKPPKDGDGAWHIKIEIIDPDGERFDRIFQSIPTTRKLSEK